MFVFTCSPVCRSSATFPRATLRPHKKGRLGWAIRIVVVLHLVCHWGHQEGNLRSIKRDRRTRSFRSEMEAFSLGSSVSSAAIKRGFLVKTSGDSGSRAFYFLLFFFVVYFGIVWWPEKNTETLVLGQRAVNRSLFLSYTSRIGEVKLANVFICFFFCRSLLLQLINRQ